MGVEINGARVPPQFPSNDWMRVGNNGARVPPQFPSDDWIKVGINGDWVPPGLISGSIGSGISSGASKAGCIVHPVLLHANCLIFCEF